MYTLYSRGDIDKAAVSKIDAFSKVRISNAEAVAEIKMGEARAAEISYGKDAEANHYGQLLSAEIGMDQKDVLKHSGSSVYALIVGNCSVNSRSGCRFTLVLIA